MIAVANAGFRAIGLDYRGYGLSDPPADPSKATYSDLITDLLEVLDSLDISKVLTLHSNSIPCPVILIHCRNWLECQMDVVSR